MVGERAGRRSSVYFGRKRESEVEKWEALFTRTSLRAEKMEREAMILVFY